MKTGSLNRNVFFTSFIVIFLVTSTASIWPETIGAMFKELQTTLVEKTGWIYILTVGGILFTAIILIVSRLGDIKLGPDHIDPEHSYPSWFAMLFSAGMGIGLMFWGVAEPVMHFTSPPVGEGSSIESAREAMKITFFHWGLHAWAIYAILALILSYFCYRKKLPLLPRSAFFPVIGNKIHGIFGDLIDVFAIIGTMFGVASSLGLGVAQVNAGIAYLFGIEESLTVQVILIAVITFFATVSVVLGLEGGIKKLSNVNVILAGILMLFILFLGDTVGLMQAFIQNTGSYLSDIIHKTFNLYAYEKKESWIGGWTLLYWGWWISWSPFVGMFIARISKGRSIREFLIGVLFVPTGFTFLWMTVFGNSAIDLILNQGHGELAQAVSSNVPVALFKFFEYFPFSQVLSILGLLLITTFFVSSSDSGSLVIDTLASGGLEEPPVWQRIFWAVTEGVVAAVLLIAGGLDALQTMSIVAAFPIIIVIIIGCYGLIVSLRADYALLSSVRSYSSVVQYSEAHVPWEKRLDALISHPARKEVLSYFRNVVRPALSELKDEMLERGLDVELSEKADKSIALVVKNFDVENFRYQIVVREFEVPEYGRDERHDSYFRVEVFLLNGGQNYDVFGYEKEQILADAITQYEKHYHYLHIANSDTV